MEARSKGEVAVKFEASELPGQHVAGAASHSQPRTGLRKDFVLAFDLACQHLCQIDCNVSEADFLPPRRSMASSSTTATISEPIVVASYSATSGRKRRNGRLPHASISHSPASKADEGLATVTIDHDGIHIVDVSLTH